MRFGGQPTGVAGDFLVAHGVDVAAVVWLVKEGEEVGPAGQAHVRHERVDHGRRGWLQEVEEAGLHHGSEEGDGFHGLPVAGGLVGGGAVGAGERVGEVGFLDGLAA